MTRETRKLSSAKFDTTKINTTRFVVCELLAADGKRLVVWSDHDHSVEQNAMGPMGGHIAGVYALARDAQTLSASVGEVLGGGFASVNPKEKKIALSGKSVTYGREPNRDLTAKLVRDAYPDWNVVFE